MVSLPKAGGEAPKRRGRPPKKVLEAQQEPAGAAASLGAAENPAAAAVEMVPRVPRPRGRPRKVVPPPEVEPSDSATQVVQAAKKETPQAAVLPVAGAEIGRASCRERV